MSQIINLKKWKELALKTTPSRIHPLVRGLYWTLFPAESDSSRLDGLPKTLSTRHVQNTAVLTDRNELLERMPKNGIIAELGTASGGFAERIQSYTNPSKLYIIDIWASGQYGEKEMEIVLNKFSSEINTEEVVVIREQSDIALTEFEDDFFDWVYIDTTHSYSQTKKELELSRQKVDEEGIIAGHDYKIGNVRTGVRYGVIEAVHEFCEKHDWELIMLTLETSGSRSFALSKIK